jgi:hypothetical protein
MLPLLISCVLCVLVLSGCCGTCCRQEASLQELIATIEMSSLTGMCSLTTMCSPVGGRRRFQSSSPLLKLPAIESRNSHSRSQGHTYSRPQGLRERLRHRLLCCFNWDVRRRGGQEIEKRGTWELVGKMRPGARRRSGSPAGAWALSDCKINALGSGLWYHQAHFALDLERDSLQLKFEQDIRRDEGYIISGTTGRCEPRPALLEACPYNYMSLCDLHVPGGAGERN